MLKINPVSQRSILSFKGNAAQNTKQQLTKKEEKEERIEKAKRIGIAAVILGIAAYLTAGIIKYNRKPPIL